MRAKSLKKPKPAPADTPPAPTRPATRVLHLILAGGPHWVLSGDTEDDAALLTELLPNLDGPTSDASALLLAARAAGVQLVIHTERQPWWGMG